MATYQYVTKSGGLTSFDAPDQTSAMKSLSSFKDADPTSGIRLVSPSPTTTAPVTTNIQNPVPASYLNTGTLPTPSLPAPTAPAINTSYVTGLTTDLQNSRTALEQSYKTQLADIEKKMQESQQRVLDLETLQQENVLKNVDQLTQPFRQTLEDTERQRLYVNENFEKNQKLTNELDSLLTQGNELIKRQKEAGGLQSIATANLNNTISDVNARAGVIQAVMSARNGQMAQAYTMIDRTAQAITSDRQDRLAYYQALNNFYEGQKDREGKKLIELTSDKKQYIAAQISLLQDDLKQSQANVDYIKKLMEDPSTALTIAQAGVTLNDTPEQVNAKLGKHLAIQQKSDLINQMAGKGYSYAATPAQLTGKTPDQIVTVFDSMGRALQFVKTTDQKAGMFDGLTSTQQTLLNGIINKYNASPLIQASDRTVVLKDVIEQVKANPKNGPAQLSLVYSYIQALDTYQSAVREGELGLVNSIDSKVGKLANSVQQIQNGQIVRPEVALDIANTAQALVDTITGAAAQKAQSFRAQASTFGFQEAWDKYISGFTPGYSSTPQNKVKTQIEEAEQNGYQPGDIINALLQPGSPVKDQVLEAQRNHWSPEEIINYLKKTSVGTDTKQGAMRTDRNNNPTAMTTDVAKTLGLVEGQDYVQGDPFDGGRYHTAKLLGDPVALTIKGIDNGGFYTASGKQRWDHTAMSLSQWKGLTYAQKVEVVKKMYQREGNGGLLNQYFS